MDRVNRGIVRKCIKDTTAQSYIDMEECAELVQAISKIHRYGVSSSTVSNLEEEIADVQIVIEHLINIYHLSETTIEEIITNKLKRVQGGDIY